MVELINVSKEFKDGVVAVDNITLTFEPGKMYVIMGPSGSGKSTILNLIGGLEECTSGRVFVNSDDVAKMESGDKAFMRMKNIGYIFQGFYLNPFLNALDNVVVPMYINPDIKGNAMKSKASNLLDKVGLCERKKHFPSQMSGGEMQRVAIARALANEPNIILADEPTGNLDEANEKKVFDLLQKFADEGKTVIVVSHNEIAKEYAHKVIYINKGKIKDE